MTTFSKREILAGSFATGLAVKSVGRARAQAGQKLAGADIAPAAARGPFQPTRASLSTYRTPDWFRDAKFGIWAHWGPQAVPAQGDWYARFMYVPGHPHYEHHLRTYGHPSEKGYKDIIALWTAEKFDPEALVQRYEAAGARYIVSMGVHHDNFDLWNSRHHRWNAVQMGPKRDIVGALRTAAKRRGLRFGVSEHLGASYNWWYPNQLYDQFWPKMGKRYDGADQRYADLYHGNRDEPFLGDSDTWYTHNPEYQRHWFARIRDLVDSYQPDLLYSDGGVPFGEIGRAMVAHLYNGSIARNGKLEAVYNHKALGSGEFDKAWGVQDVERGVLSGINPLPWQTDTSNGDWFYTGDVGGYKATDEVITMLVDIVSKNGNMLLNVVLRPDGSLPPPSEQLLNELTPWMAANGTAIHGTRPWHVYGEGPTQAKEGAFQEKAAYTPQDIRFTTKGETLYAITLGEPKGPVAITSLARGNPHEKRRVRQVRLLGHPGAIDFRQSDQALVITPPASLPTRHASAFEIHFA